MTAIGRTIYLKERIPCENQRASLLMGNCSRVLRWAISHWSSLAASSRLEGIGNSLAPLKTLVSSRGPELEFPWRTVHIRRAPEGTQGSLPDDLSLGTVFFTVLPNTFWLEIQRRRGRRLLRNAQLGAAWRGVLQPVEPSYTICSTLRWSRAGAMYLLTANVRLCEIEGHSSLASRAHT